jgi:mannose-1-phosphate guanylyltransferase/mannose-6-phosphate isomerase
MVQFAILCGGSGSRLWPKSREKLPKQFLSLTNEFTMLQNTVQRLLFLETCMKKKEKNKLLILCNKDHTHIVENQLKEMNLSIEYRIVSEPLGRDSAPAICISSLLGSPDDITIVLPCDHIMDEKEFSRCCIQSFEYTDKSIVTFGIQPSHPETGYGYIETNSQFETIQFIEKPDIETAEKYIQQGNYLWNAGIFVFQNKNMNECFQKYAPDILNQCITTIKETVFTNSIVISLNESSFSRCRAISVDYAIMEKLCSDKKSPIHKITLPYQNYWNDIGSYMALYQQLEKDVNQNVVKGDVWTMNTKNTYIETEKSMVATIGVENLIIVNTDDALLVCRNDKTQEVKK